MLDYNLIGDEISTLIKQPLIDDANAELLVFPDANELLTGRAISRNRVILAITNQNWTPLNNGAALSQPGVNIQNSDVSLFFYIRSTSLRGPKGIYAIANVIDRELTGISLDRTVGPLYPTSLSYDTLEVESCTWNYSLSYTFEFINGKNKGRLKPSVLQPPSPIRLNI